MPPIRPSVKQAAFEEIRRRILTGKLHPGAPLGEAELQRELQLTRTPIRDALALLQADGLAEPDATGSGLRVPVPHYRTLRAAAATRFAVETLIACELAMRPEAERDLSEVEELLARQEALAGKPSPTEEERLAFFQLDIDFHGGLARRAEYHQCVGLLRSLHQQLRLIALPTIAAGMEWVIVQHRAILDAVGSGDPARASAAMRHHLESAAGRWYGYMGPFLGEELPRLFRLIGAEAPTGGTPAEEGRDDAVDRSRRTRA
jgi:DNA-binding GntR family transcriptional regulator